MCNNEIALLAQGENQAPSLALLERLARARAFMDEHFDQPLDLGQISAHACCSRYHFIRAFRKAYSLTPHQYLIQRRIASAKDLLTAGELSVTQVCYAVGFQSLGTFSALFRRNAGLSPRQFRANALARRRLGQRYIPGCFISLRPRRQRRSRD